MMHCLNIAGNVQPALRRQELEIGLPDKAPKLNSEQKLILAGLPCFSQNGMLQAVRAISKALTNYLEKTERNICLQCKHIVSSHS